ncbi:predicted protein [Uncinocarpus reesii 1704]|uniref:Uncharacterized protein n=1 Tax=Uncinocarpus reesii (strain UAMH 1704) TaxID=336963 RepID=C4JKE5_UNCRE|nr:uncharacterized protein UREG_02102 [Uncinocarpus reesii 1704]EEP77253.1 predicted protein [Uncinocarpus reesii 1704]
MYRIRRDLPQPKQYYQPAHVRTARKLNEWKIHRTIHRLTMWVRQHGRMGGVDIPWGGYDLPVSRGGDEGGLRFRLGPGFKTREAKRKMVNCAISGSILAIVLAVYMTLALTTSIRGREFHIFLILILMILTVYFCHSFVRLFMIASKPTADQESYDGRRVRFGETDHPIRVTFARDEEVVESDMETNRNASLAPPPPAYGLWRGSMRINPNMIYWQRVNGTDSGSGTSSTSTDEPRPATANRPPSYVSDDGVRYVLDVQPRSTQMPPHGQVPEIHVSDRSYYN